MIFNKKGDLTLRYLILAILGVVVLIVVLIIFSGGIGEFVSKLKDMFNEVWGLKPDLTTAPTK